MAVLRRLKSFAGRASSQRGVASSTGSINGALLLPDGRRVMWWSDDGALRLWQLDGVDEPRVLAGHEYSVGSALLSVGSRYSVHYACKSKNLLSIEPLS